jgi:succinate dehydrogenase / fumarate reductase flavoprotein subunit
LTSRVVVVGAGVTGLAAAGELARRGVPVDLVSLVAPRRSVVASSSDAIAAARDDDDVAAHAADAAWAGASPDEAAATRALVAAAPRIVARLAALDVPFARDADGSVARRRGGGHRSDRLATCGPDTKREIVEALDHELAVLERDHPGRVRRLEEWEVVAIAVDDGACVGVVAQDLRSMEIHGIPARAVLLASGGFAGAWGATSATSSAGSATAAAARVGAELVDLDALDLAPLAIVGRAKRHAVSELLRAAGARIWVPADATETRRGRDVPSKERRDLLADLAADDGRIAPPDAVARAIARALVHEGAGVFEAARGAVTPRAYLDVLHLAPTLSEEGRAEVARLARVTGVDLLAAQALVAPAVNDTLGGLLVRFERGEGGELDDGNPMNHASTVPGLYAAGSAACAYHGTTRLPGHRLLEGIFGGELAARAVVAHRASLDEWTPRATRAVEAAENATQGAYAALLARKGDDDQRVIRAELGHVLDAAAGLDAVDEVSSPVDRLDALAARLDECGAGDGAHVANRGAPALRRLECAWLLARVAVVAAAAREEAKVAGDPVTRIVVRVGDTPSPAGRGAAS